MATIKQIKLDCKERASALPLQYRTAWANLCTSAITRKSWLKADWVLAQQLLDDCILAMEAEPVQEPAPAPTPAPVTAPSTEAERRELNRQRIFWMKKISVTKKCFITHRPARSFKDGTFEPELYRAKKNGTWYEAPTLRELALAL